MSESATSPQARLSHRRPRVSNACVACKQKKQKCDGQTPACRNCVRARRPCISHDPATKRQHPRGYLESLERHNNALEEHIAFLEGKIHEIQPDNDLDQLMNAHDGGEPLVSEINDPPLPPDGSQQDRSLAGVSPSSNEGNLQQRPDDLSTLGLLCLQSSGGEPHYFGTSSAYSFTNLFSATLRAVRAQAPGLSMAGVTDASVQSRPKPAPAPLPSRTVTGMLSTAYFDQVHPQFPFLHQPTYTEWEDNVMTALEGGYTPDSSKLFFVYAITAIGALTGPLAGATLPEGLYASAEKLFEHVMQLNTLESIQALLCCAMYSIRSPYGVSVWTLSGMALRQCIELGLHRKIPWSKLESDILKTQMRRRVFWCAYNLDRATAITLGRPVGINDADIDTEFPLDINDEYITTTGLLAEPRRSSAEPPTTMSAAIHTIAIRQLWARIQTAMYPQIGFNAPIEMTALLVQGFRTELQEWLNSAPKQLASNRAYNNTFSSPEWWQLMYDHSILLLHRRALVSPNDPSIGNIPPPSVHLECARAAQSICTIYRQLYISQRLNDTWGALHVLFLGGITFLYCIWTNAEVRAEFRQDQVSLTCMNCMVVLAVMSERWNAVGPYRDVFDALSSATQTMLANRDTAAAVTPTVPILSASDDNQFSGFLSHLTEIGLCSSVEELLTSMID